MEKEPEKLLEIGNRIPFVAPNDYFEQLPIVMNKQIAPKKISLFEKTKPLLYFAAMFAGFYIVIHFIASTFNQEIIPSNPELAFEIIDDSYYNYVMTELDEELIVDYLLAEN